MTDEDVAYFCSAVGVALRPMNDASSLIAQKYDLGPRGPWILGMIQVGVTSPSRLSELLGIGRSLLTSELNRLSRAQLIDTRKHVGDGRRVMLSLTPEGTACNEQLRAHLTSLTQERLTGYSREEILLCTRLLRDFAADEPQYYDP